MTPVPVGWHHYDRFKRFLLYNLSKFPVFLSKHDKAENAHQRKKAFSDHAAHQLLKYYHSHDQTDCCVRWQYAFFKRHTGKSDNVTVTIFSQILERIMI